MPLTIQLQGERGDVIETIFDDTNLLRRILPASDDANFHSLSRIDYYGDTTFNRMQIEDVIREIGRLQSDNFSPAEKEMLDAVVDLAKRGLEEPHLYLKFIGD